MSNYTIEIQKLVNSALEELNAGHQSGKVINAPVSNNHFLVRWVTIALKTQRFERSVVADLVRWQKMGRSKGNQSQLMPTFQRISKLYGQFFEEGTPSRPILDSDVEAFLDLMDDAGWEVVNDQPLTSGGKVQIFTDGQNSFAMCGDQCDSCFDGELMVKPMNWFVRGNHAEFIEKATEAGFLLHKVTDYKSVVKYHGEYVVYPNNEGTQLAEIPLSIQP